MPRPLEMSVSRAALLLPLLLAACSSDDAARSTEASTDGGASRDAAVSAFGKCSDAPPAGATLAPDPRPYTGGSCPTLTTGADAESHITSSGKDRSFMLIVPDEIRSGESLPLVFLWHWLNASAKSFYDRAFVKDAVNQQRFIAVLPESIGTLISDWRGWFNLSPTSEADRDEEFAFFDDMLTCVSEQFPVNRNCVSSAGVSDGALWTSQLVGGRGEYLASAIVLSGGVGGPDDPDPSGNLLRDYPGAEGAHRPPAIVLWGGPNDSFLGLMFQPATKALEQHLTEDGHFIVECQHNCGHDEPPFDAPPGKTKFAAFWDFVNDHPYWLAPGTSPYLETGKLPTTFPDWCGIGPGSATEREGGGCANLVGQALGGGPKDGG
ncbi:MAG TPA: hypothetical protein VHE30_24015 [Polyangiaceae bacterium]|nr:hypothetical protein [Polyangiaceae bacterium]